MKRLLVFLSLASLAHGAGVVQQSLQQLGNTNNWVLAYNWTGDASSGSVPNTTAQNLTCCQGYFVTQVETVPGTPSPTAGYSIAVQDASGVDVLGGTATGLSATTPQAFAAATTAAPIQGSLTLVISGQSVASAKGVVFVFISKPGTVNTATLGKTPPSSGGGGGGTGNAAAIVTVGFAASETYTCPSATAGSVVDFQATSNAPIVLTGNITSAAISSCTPGALLNWIFKEDATGGRTVVMPTGDACPVNLAPNITTKCNYYYDGATLRLLGADSDAGYSQCGEGSPPGANPLSGKQYLNCDSSRHTFTDLNPSGATHIMPQTACLTDQICAQDISTITYCTGGGTANAQTVACTPANQSLVTGLTVRWTPTNTNTSATTLAVDSLTAKNLTKCGTTALVAGDLTTAAVATATYDGTEFQLLNAQSSGGGCGAGSGGGGGGGSSFTDQTIYGFRDDFVTNNLVPSGGVCTGEAAYGCATVGSMTMHGLVPTTNHPGILECSSSATNPSNCEISTNVDIQAATLNGIPSLSGVSGWKFTCVFNLHQNTASQAWVCGLSNGQGSNPSNGIYIRFDNFNFSDTNYSLICAQSGVYSTNSLGTAPSNAWHTAIIQPGTNVNTVKVTFDGTTTDNLCSNTTIPTTNLNLLFAYNNANTTSGNLADLDFWAFSMPLTR